MSQLCVTFDYKLNEKKLFSYLRNKKILSATKFKYITKLYKELGYLLTMTVTLHVFDVAKTTSFPHRPMFVDIYSIITPFIECMKYFLQSHCRGFEWDIGGE